jgi:hypothetical protein
VIHGQKLVDVIGIEPVTPACKDDAILLGNDSNRIQFI